MYSCMFVSALPDPTCNSEKSANGGNKQILLLLLLLSLCILSSFHVTLLNLPTVSSLFEGKEAWSGFQGSFVQ